MTPTGTGLLKITRADGSVLQLRARWANLFYHPTGTLTLLPIMYFNEIADGSSPDAEDQALIAQYAPPSE